MSLSDMTWASANTPYYFKPAVINGNVYISGDNLAMSPAMFAYHYADEKKSIPNKDIRIVSIGATNELAERINNKASLHDWASRLTTLSAPVKKHTMDYMLEHLLRKDGHELHKYEVDTTREWESEFYNSNLRLPTLVEMSQQMIFSNRLDIE